ncbi:MAG: hypothetical protein Tsb0034_00390 [Ekhidna sp.]
MAEAKINRQQLLLEFISVVFAVLLALFLNAWRENAAIARNVQKVKKTIKTEILRNHEVVADKLDYRQRLISELREGRHLITALPASSIPVDVTDDRALERHLRKTLPFSQSTLTKNIEIRSLDGQRILIMDDKVMKLDIKNDTIKLYGVNNIQLRTADITNRSWEIARATGTLVEMDLDFVDALNEVYNLNNLYLETSNMAIEMIYKNEPGIRSILEDMAFYEREILRADSLVLSHLQDF